MRIDWKNISLEVLAGFISEELKKRSIEVVLVGGACATIYSHNLYQSYDLDFVTYENMKKVRQALYEIGFREKAGYFRHANCKWFIEFVSPPIAIGDEPIRKFATKKTALGTIKMLRVEDSVKDRLASYFHWNDLQGLDQALNICLESEVDYNEIKKWSIREGFENKFVDFENKLKQKKVRRRAR